MKTNRKLGRTSRNAFINYAMVIVAYLVIQVMISGGQISFVLRGQLVPICAYVVMALSLNLVVGISGELSLGHAGFMSVGAFSGVIASVAMQGMIPSGPLRLALAMLVGAIAASIMGVLIGIPVLRLRGDYLAIVTLAFGEIIKNLVTVFYVGMDKSGLHLSMSNAGLTLDETGKVLMSGPMGALNYTRLSTFTAGAVLVLVTLFVVQNLVNSRSGRAIMAIRDNRIAAEATGISVTKYKMMAFVTASAFAGAAGVLYALNYTTVVAKKFDFNTSILVLVFVVLGGLGNLRGSIIAAALLTVLPEILREFNEYRMLIYAIVLILVMILTNNEQAKAVRAKLLMHFDRWLTGVRGKKPKAEGGAGDE